MAQSPTSITPAPTDDFEDDCPSLDVLHEQAEWALDRAHDRADGIDAKTGVVLTASSFIIAGVTVLQAAIASHLTTLAPWWEIVARILGCLAAAFFLAVLFPSIYAMWPRDFTIAPSPSVLRKKYLGKHEKITKAVVMNARVNAYKPTTKTIRQKTRAMMWAFAALCAEGLLLAIILVIAALAL